MEINNFKRDSSSWIAAAAAGSVVLGTLALTAPFLSRSPLPYMATPAGKVRRALESVKSKRHKFVDLGSGDGEAVYQATQVGYRQSVGVELNWTLVSLAQLRRLLWTADERSRSTFHRQDLFQYNLSDADTVLIFGVNPLMVPISRKLAAECRAGTHILSYRFKLPLYDNEATNDLLDADIVYDHEEMVVYRSR